MEYAHYAISRPHFVYLHILEQFMQENTQFMYVIILSEKTMLLFAYENVVRGIANEKK